MECQNLTQRCKLMACKKDLFEKKQNFSKCIPAVGEGKRIQWHLSSLRTDRSEIITLLKKRNLAWKEGCAKRKITYRQKSAHQELQDRNDLFRIREVERGLYSTKEMNWIHKIFSTLCKKHGSPPNNILTGSMSNNSYS